MAVLAVAMGLSGYHTVTKLSVDNSLGIWFLEDDPRPQGQHFLHCTDGDSLSHQSR